MKLRAHTIPIVCIMIGLASLIMGGSANAQMFPQPPMLAPYNPSMNMGLFYLSAGVKYRNIQTVRFELTPHLLSIIVADGSPPWGPNEDGFVSYPFSETIPLLPSLNPADPPSTSGIWVYDNGEIDPQNPAVNPVAPAVTPVDGPFLAPDRRLGWHNGSQNSSGSFLVTDPSAQANGATYESTSRVTYSRLMDGRSIYETESLGYQGEFDVDRKIEFTNKIVTPYFEAGYRVSNFFNILFGFSWFNISEVYQTNLVGQGLVIRRTFNDSVFFRSLDPNTWLPSGFTSKFPANATTGGNPDPATYYYILYPAGTGTSMNLPTRTFGQAVDGTVAPFGVQETLYNKLEFTALEFKAGSRSWFPLYGFRANRNISGFVVDPGSLHCYHQTGDDGYRDRTGNRRGRRSNSGDTIENTDGHLALAQYRSLCWRGSSTWLRPVVPPVQRGV